MMNSKQSVFHGPAQAHSALYLSSHYHQQPGMNPHITAMHANIPRNIAPKPNNQMPVTVSIANMAVSPPPPLQISPPLHQHLNIQQHQPISMQQSIGNQLPMQVQPALHSPTMQQVSLSFSVVWGARVFWDKKSSRSLHSKGGSEWWIALALQCSKTAEIWSEGLVFQRWEEMNEYLDHGELIGPVCASNDFHHVLVNASCVSPSNSGGIL